jgi:UDP-N-acetylglucosamine 1-carboxyvinyltransferase
MPSLVIEGLAGQKSLRGSIPVFGAKNAVLPTMAATLLIQGETTITNVPGIADIDSMTRLLERLGAFVSRSGDTLTVNARDVSGSVLDYTAAKSLRASVLLIGSVLARTGSVTFPHPGGDLIGERPIDLFIAGLTTLGATVSEAKDTYTLSAPQGLTGGEFFFSTVSVTATETMLMAATLARGTVVLRNAAMEPEVVALADFLKSAGARIEGAGTPVIVIKPVTLVEPPPYTVIPDRIEAASFLTLGALAAEEITVTNVTPHHLDAVIDVLVRMGVPLSISDTSITVRAPETIQPVRVRTHEYPGFPTDAHPPIMIALTQAAGESILIESIFDGRLNYTQDLVRMGADITLISPHRASVKGPRALTATEFETPDIRAGLAFVLGSIIAKGTSVVGNAGLIDRGYQNIEERLSAVGVAISRKN